MSKSRSSGEPATFSIASHRRPGGHFTGPKEKAKDPKSTLNRLWGYLKQQKKGLITALLLLLMTTALNTAGPYIMKIAIDQQIMGKTNFPELLKILILMGAVYFCASALTLLQQWIMISVSQKAIQNLRKDLFHQYQVLTINFFDRRSTGELMSRMTNDIDNISNTLSTGVIEIFSSVLSVTSISIIMIVMSWQLGLICLCVIPLVILLTKQISKHTRLGFQDRQQYLGELNGIIEESITGHRVIKAYTKEKEWNGVFSVLNEKVKKSSNRANIASGLLGPLMNMMNNLSFGITALAGGVLAVFGIVSVGTIAAFLNYSRQISRPLNNIAQLYTSIQSAIAGAERVFAILDEKPELEDAPGALSLDRIRGQVDLRDVHFRYIHDIPVLRGITIHAEPGETIALVGPTGAGKTTIISLLMRFYDYQSGDIRIDGTDIRSIRMKDLRQSMGIVLQDTFLFSGSVKENIRYGRLAASDEEIIKASKLANAHQFIHRMPQGYETEISENGSSLSQGQRQLIAIARTILSDPSILILDEATSSVDTRTEFHIQEGLQTLMQ